MDGVLRQRDYTWDVMKFMLISLVILGHWLEYGLGSGVNRVVFNFIYLFHMPLFIFISGYFSKKKDKSKFKTDILHLIVTYVVVQILYVVTSYFLQHKPFGLQQLYMPNAAAWYLLCLVFWRLLLQIVPDKFLNCWWVLLLSIAVSLSAGFLPVSNELSLQRILAFLPFFMGGYLLRGKIEFGAFPKSLKVGSIGVLGIIAVACIFMLNRDVSYVIWCNSNYYTPPYSEWILMLLRALFLGVASIMICCIIILFPKINTGNF